MKLKKSYLICVILYMGIYKKFKETALNIGRTCRLIEEIGHNEIKLTYSVQEQIEKEIDKFIFKFVKKFFLNLNEQLTF